jgi:hypothetical protein
MASPPAAAQAQREVRLVHPPDDRRLSGQSPAAQKLPTFHTEMFRVLRSCQRSTRKPSPGSYNREIRLNVEWKLHAESHVSV